MFVCIWNTKKEKASGYIIWIIQLNNENKNERHFVTWRKYFFQPCSWIGQLIKSMGQPDTNEIKHPWFISGNELINYLLYGLASGDDLSCLSTRLRKKGGYVLITRFYLQVKFVKKKHCSPASCHSLPSYLFKGEKPELWATSGQDAKTTSATTERKNDTKRKHLYLHRFRDLQYTRWE